MKKETETPWERHEKWFARMEEIFAEREKENAEREREYAEYKKENAEREKEYAEYKKRSEWEWNELKKHLRGITLNRGREVEDNLFYAISQSMTFAGVKFDVIDRNKQINDENLKTLTDFDIIMINGDSVALIEVKADVESRDVRDLIGRKKRIFRERLKMFDNHKLYLGIGGELFDNDAIEEAKANGVGVIRVVGEKVEFFTDKIVAH